MKIFSSLTLSALFICSLASHSAFAKQTYVAANSDYSSQLCAAVLNNDKRELNQLLSRGGKRAPLAVSMKRISKSLHCNDLPLAHYQSTRINTRLAKR